MPLYSSCWVCELDSLGVVYLKFSSFTSHNTNTNTNRHTDTHMHLKWGLYVCVWVAHTKQPNTTQRGNNESWQPRNVILSWRSLERSSAVDRPWFAGSLSATHTHTPHSYTTVRQTQTQTYKDRQGCWFLASVLALRLWPRLSPLLLVATTFWPLLLLLLLLWLFYSIRFCMKY